MRDIKKGLYWRCPNPECKYTISDTEYMLLVGDLQCPNCSHHRAILSNFIGVGHIFGKPERTEKERNELINNPPEV